MNELCIIGIWNLAVFLLYGADKLFAIQKRRRISERTLLTSSLLLGGVGAFFGMEIWRHKTKHKKFRVVAILSLILTTVACVYMSTN